MISQKLTWKSLLPLCFSIVICTMSYGLVIPTLASLFLEPNSTMVAAHTTPLIRNSFYTWALSLPMIFMFFGAPLLGNLSDRIGRKKVLVLALFGISMSCLLSTYGIVNRSVMFLLLGRAFLGLMDGSLSIAQAAISDMSKSADKVINLGFITLAGTVGFAVGPSLGGYLSDYFSESAFRYEIPFILASLLAFVNAIWLSLFFQETFIPLTISKNIKLKNFWAETVIFRDKKIQRLSIAFFLLQLSWGSYFQSIPMLLINSYSFTAKGIGLFMSIVALSFSLISLFGIRFLIKVFERETIIMIGLPLIALGTVILFLFPQEEIMWFSILPLTLGVGLSYNTLLSLLSDTIGNDNQGKIMGISTSLMSLAWLLSALLSSTLSTIYIKLPYLMVCGVALLNLYLFNKAQFYKASKKERAAIT